MKHKHADLIKAWADGAEIEAKGEISGQWYAVAAPQWHESMEYRIKPEPKPDIVMFLGCDDYGTGNGKCCEDFQIVDHWDNQLKLTFCGETGKIKSAEVLK